MRILLTGHRGFIGRHLHDQLLDQGHEIIGLDLEDGADISTMINFPKDIDVVYHLAAQSKVLPSIKNPTNDAYNNILVTIKLLQEYPDTRFIFTSSGGAIQDTIESPYGLSKDTCERYIKMLNSQYIILRLANVYGRPDSQSVIDKFLAKEPETNIIYGSGHSTRDYVHLDDVLLALKRARNWKTKQTYKIGTGRKIPLLLIAEKIGKPYEHTSPKKGELLHSIVGNTAPVIRGKRMWEAKIHVFDYIDEQKNLSTS